LARSQRDAHARAPRKTNAGSAEAPGARTAEAEFAAASRGPAPSRHEGAPIGRALDQRVAGGQAPAHREAGGEPPGHRGASRSADRIASRRRRAIAGRVGLPVRVVLETGPPESGGRMAASEPAGRSNPEAADPRRDSA